MTPCSSCAAEEGAVASWRGDWIPAVSSHFIFTARAGGRWWWGGFSTPWVRRQLLYSQGRWCLKPIPLAPHLLSSWFQLQDRYLLGRAFTGGRPDEGGKKASPFRICSIWVILQEIKSFECREMMAWGKKVWLKTWLSEKKSILECSAYSCVLEGDISYSTAC